MLNFYSWEWKLILIKKISCYNYVFGFTKKEFSEVFRQTTRMIIIHEDCIMHVAHQRFNYVKFNRVYLCVCLIKHNFFRKICFSHRSSKQ